jgi:hypothetical protein
MRLSELWPFGTNSFRRWDSSQPAYTAANKRIALGDIRAASGIRSVRAKKFPALDCAAAAVCSNITDHLNSPVEWCSDFTALYRCRRSCRPITAQAPVSSTLGKCRRTPRYVLTRLDVDGGLFENALCWVKSAWTKDAGIGKRA